MSGSGDEKGYVYSKLVRINSGAASTRGQSGYSDTNFVINLGQSMQNIWRVSFLNVVFTNSAYNVRSNSENSPNSQFRFLLNGITYGGAVSDGFYNVSQLTSTIATIVNGILTGLGAGQSISFTQNALSQRVILTYAPGTSGVTSFTLLDNINGTDSLWRNLGYNFTSPTTDVYSRIISENVPNLTGLRQVYLQSAALAPGNQIDEQGLWQNVCLAIPVTAAFGDVNVFECKVDSLCMITYQSKRNLSVLDFQLVDDKGNIVNLNGTTVKLELKVWSDSL